MPPKFKTTPQPAVALAFIIDPVKVSLPAVPLRRYLTSFSLKKTTAPSLPRSMTYRPRRASDACPTPQRNQMQSAQVSLYPATAAFHPGLICFSPAVSRPLTSSFLPTINTGAASRPFSVVTFIIISLQDSNKAPIFPWPGKDNSINGRLYNDKVYHGRDKAVFEVRDLNYVAIYPLLSYACSF